MRNFFLRRKPPGDSQPKSALREWTEVVVGAILLFLVFRTFAFQAFQIPSESMEDTLLVGDHLFVNKFLFGPTVPVVDWRLPGVREPRRGDVVVFTYMDEPGTTYIKRVIGTPGDVVQIDRRELSVNGEPVAEPYVKHIVPRLRPPAYQEAGIVPPGAGNLDYYGPVTVPDGRYFLLGDNRENSEDSRFRGFIPREAIKGKAAVIYWSWDRERRWPRFARFGDVIR